jgi:hypothetical protein
MFDKTKAKISAPVERAATVAAIALGLSILALAFALAGFMKGGVPDAV